MNLKRERFLYKGEKNLYYKEWEFYSTVKSIHDNKYMLILAPYIGDKENEMFVYPFGHIAVYEEEFYKSFLIIKEDGTTESQKNKLIQNINPIKEYDIRKFNKLKKEINEKLKIPVSIKREDDFIIIAIPDSTNMEIYQRVFLLATMILDEKDFDKIAIIDDLNMEIPKEEYEKYYINN